MQKIDEKKFRADLQNFIENGERGTKARIAREAGISRDTLDRILSGGAAYDSTMDRIQAAMDASRVYPISEDKTEADHWNVIADDLEALAKLLRSSIDGDRKAERFAYTVGFYQAEMEAGLAQLKQNRK